MFITKTMEQSSVGSKRHDEPDDYFNLKEWALKGKISRENTNSRRFSASNLKSFRENDKSFRSSITISSTVSSPGYTIRGGIDPSTYSFSTALKALQAKTVYTWEYISPDNGLTLNSKWNDAEKYISNPLSGQVPIQCLSSKTLSRTTITPFFYHPNSQLHHQPNSPIIRHQNEVDITIQEEKRSRTRDVGIQSTPSDLSSITPTPTPTPTSTHPPNITATQKLKSQAMVEVKERREKLQKYRKRNEGRERNKVKMKMMMMMCRHGGKGGCLSFLWRHNSRKTNTNNNLIPPKCFYHVNASFEQ